MINDNLVAELEIKDKIKESAKETMPRDKNNYIMNRQKNV
jgi:hypothetical protein